ncbi:MAG: hypothetical protein BHV70_07555 [Bacteroidales bacterium 55_9]|nr:MAG: hypothetical protein BHV70_07555 [Bacteroidales bacterium 55_9]
MRLPASALYRKVARSLSNTPTRGGATVGKDRQKAGGDTQEINPADAFACRSAEAGESVLYRRGA